jgi:hypothetical protein
MKLRMSKSEDLMEKENRTVGIFSAVEMTWKSRSLEIDSIHFVRSTSLKYRI